MEPFNAEVLIPPTIVHRYPEFESRSIRDYNITYNLTRKGRADVTFSYLTGLMLGKVLSEALLEGTDLSDGAVSARRFLNRTLDTRVGSFYISADGETRMDRSVSYFNYTTSHREVELIFLYLTVVLDFHDSFQWFLISQAGSLTL
ncbi:hypothetical protein RvY_04547 [Ramazzottius varieornatus]|uniref:Uncharacterized protein n=1 Tax=Ramazzottius varieornatus TaxID=947166 RepID=A0A1D1USM1_RAMVA|nr:hypothetical protein RvY_04547 [Ramazzottius varieornatus]